MSSTTVCCLQPQLLSWSPLWTFGLLAFHRHTENPPGFTFWCLGTCSHDSFRVWAADKHSQASAWKNNWFSPGMLSNAAYWSSVPRDCFLLPSAIWSARPLCSYRGDVGCPAAIGYNQCGHSGKQGVFLLSSVAVSLRSCCQAPLVAEQGLREKGRNRFVMYEMHVSAKLQSNLISDYLMLIHPPALVIRCFYDGIFPAAHAVCTLSSAAEEGKQYSVFCNVWWVLCFQFLWTTQFPESCSKPPSNPVWSLFGIGNAYV